MKIRITAAAEAHLRDGYRFYEQQAEGLGEYFIESISADIESLRIHAGVHAVHFGRYHRMVAKRFPFSIYYRLENAEINVRAVLDDRRNPAWIRQLLTPGSDDRA